MGWSVRLGVIRIVENMYEDLKNGKMDAVKNKKTAWVKNTRAALFLLKCVLSLNVMFKN